jgi:hypothetical protein
MTKVGICDTVFAHVQLERSTMVKDRKHADQIEAFSKDAAAQGHQAVDTYFDLLKKTVSLFPTGGFEFGERVKDQAVENITAIRELVKKLSQAKDLEEAIGIQTEFMLSRLDAFAKQVAILGGDVHFRRS